MGKRILYYDCFAGISGDMNLGALVDVGVPESYLRAELKKLNIEGYELGVRRDGKLGIHGTRVDVEVQESAGHDHHHSENEHHHRTEQEHRTYKDIVRLIDDCGLPPSVKEKSVAIFSKVAEAEGKVHNVDVSDVHFHEVGAIDSIIDIVGAAICLDYLKPDQIIASSVELGGGFVRCAHGRLPVPAPATAEILTGVPVKSDAVPFEATTPTGAAILAACVDVYTDRKQFVVERVGYGVGHRDAEIPNVLRVFLAGSKDDENEVNDFILECNIDDMNPEIYGYLAEKFFSNGAADVYFTPIIMKKSRPGTKLSVLCNADIADRLSEMILRETTTFGLRRVALEKTSLEREIKTVSTSFGDVRIKTGFLSGEPIKSKPEYEDCRRIAEERRLSLLDVYTLLSREISE